MNCKNIEPLLPLYAGNDLEEEEVRLVAAHLQRCTECTLAADEYAWAGQLLQRYEPPLFSDEVYSGIREQVLSKIESHAPMRPGIFSKLLLALVQPRMRWVTATVLLAISVAALYLTRKPSRQPNDQQIAVRMEVTNESADSSAPSSSSSNQEEGRVASKRRPITRKREANRVVQRAVVISQPSPAPAPLRVELQTSDRNIRIIWLSGPRPDADGTDGSKGL